MNKILTLLLGGLTICVLSGCLAIPLNYTSDVELTKTNIAKRYAVTFSVDYLSDGDDSIGRASQEKYIDWLKEYLNQSGAFSSVSYKPFAQKSNYHIHFLIHYSCMPVDQAAALGSLMGYTLFTIPMWLTMYLDTSAILYLNGVPVCSPAAAEALRSYVWAPFLPVGLIWNQWWAWTTQEKKCCRYLINEVTKFQADAEKNPHLLKRFLAKKKIAEAKKKKVPEKAVKDGVFSGTVFAVGEDIVVTARHLVANRKKIKVCFDGKNWLEAALVKQSEALDIAILKISGKLENYLPLTAKEAPYAGDKVFTFGYPVVSILGGEIKYTEGVISSMSGLKDDQTLIQTTVPIQPGNSGSPLLNEEGEVIGMLTSSAALPAFFKVTGTLPQNINWAVKADYISLLMNHKNSAQVKKFKNRREFMKAVRKAICQVMAESGD